MQLLLVHAWPGNVRELDHTLERAVLMARGVRIGVADLGLAAQRASLQSLDDLSLEAVESILIQKASRARTAMSRRQPRRLVSAEARSTGGWRSMASRPGASPPAGPAKTALA